MPLLRRILLRWLPFAGATVMVSGLVYLTSQQMWRQMANDPQIQVARDAAMRLAAGQPPDAVVPAAQIDFSQSAALFVEVLNDAGAILKSSGTLRGQLRTTPSGVFDHARVSGEERVTWQPERGVRIASVVVRIPGAPGGFVLAGRSLQETGERVDRFQNLIGLACLAILAALLVLVAAVETVGRA